MSSYSFNLRVPKEEITTYAKKYRYVGKDEELEIIKSIAPIVRSRGYVTKEEFEKVCRWKSPRTQAHCTKNSAEYIQEITRIAFSTASEQVRIEILTLLQGVDWPTASVFLHFFHQDSYPILDFRALFSLGYEEKPIYNFAFWSAYTKYCRELVSKLQIDMRTLDKALWQYSKTKQTKKENQL